MQTQNGLYYIAGKSSPSSEKYSNPFSHGVYIKSHVSDKSTSKNTHLRQAKSCNWAVTWYFQQCGMCDQQNSRSACAYAQTYQSLCLSHDCSTSVKLLTEHHLEFRSLKGGCTGSSELTLVKNATLREITCRCLFMRYVKLVLLLLKPFNAKGISDPYQFDENILNLSVVG